jgi:hypothetical protein
MNTSIASLPAPVLSDLSLNDGKCRALIDDCGAKCSRSQSKPIRPETGRKRKRNQSDDSIGIDAPNDSKVSILVPDSTHSLSFVNDSISIVSDEEDSSDSYEDRPFAVVSGLTKHGKTFQLQFKSKLDLINHVRSNWLVNEQCQFCWNCGFQGQNAIQYVDAHLNLLATVAITCVRSHSHVSCASAKRCNQSIGESGSHSLLNQSSVEPAVKRKRRVLESDSWTGVDDEEMNLRPEDDLEQPQHNKVDSTALTRTTEERLSTARSPLSPPTIRLQDHEALIVDETTEDDPDNDDDQDDDDEKEDRLSGVDESHESIGQFDEDDSESEDVDMDTKNKSSGSLFSWIGSFFKFN